MFIFFFFFFQAEDGIRDGHVTGVQTCALPISHLHAGDGLAVPLLGNERGRRCQPDDDGSGEFAWRRFGEIPVGLQHIAGPIGAPGDQPAGDGRADLMQAEREPGDDPEVAATASDRPEQVLVVRPAGRADLSVCGDDFDLLQVVDRPAEPASQVAKSAAERQAGHSSLGHEAEHRRQPVLLRGLVDVLEQAPRPNVRKPGIGVNRDVAHAGHVPHQSVPGDRGSGDVVASAHDAEQQLMFSGETDGLSAVEGRNRLDDERREPGHHAVPHEHRVVPSLVPRSQNRTCDPRVQILEPLRREADPSSLECDDIDGPRGHDRCSLFASRPPLSTHSRVYSKREQTYTCFWSMSRARNEPRQSLTTTSYAVLAQLALRPWSTYELARQRIRYFRYVWPRAESAIYREVKRLATMGLIAAERQYVGKRPRTMYSMTEEGRQVLREWLATPVSPFAMDFEAMIRLFIAPLGTKEQIVATLQQVRSDAQEMLRFGGQVKREFLDGRAALQDQVHIRGVAVDFFVSHF